MLVLAADAENINPIYVDSFSFYIGQRVDVVLCTNATADDWSVTFDSAQPELGYCGPICGAAASIR